LIKSLKNIQSLLIKIPSGSKFFLAGKYGIKYGVGYGLSVFTTPILLTPPSSEGKLFVAH